MNTETEELVHFRGKEGNNILTDRAVEYLSLVAMGNKNKEIANILSVSISTVKKTLEMIYYVLNAKDRANAVTIAFVHCILTPNLLNEINLKYNLKQNMFL